MKKCSPSLSIKEMQIKTTRFYLTSVRIAINKNNKQQQKLGRTWGKGTLIHC
jgi:hypothetical protein